MHGHKRFDLREELILAQALIYFVFIGIGTVTVAVAAHLR